MARRKQSGGKPAAASAPADGRGPDQNSADKPSQNGPSKRSDVPQPTSQAFAPAKAPPQLPATQNGPAKRADGQPTSQAGPTGKAPTRGGDTAPASKQPTPKNGLHPKAAGLAPPNPTQPQPADAAGPTAEHASGQRQAGAHKVGRPSNTNQAHQIPTSNGQRRGPADNGTADTERPTLPAASSKSPLANGSRAMPGGVKGGGSPAKGQSRQGGRGTANGNAPAQNPWQIRAQQRESAMVQGMQRMRLNNSGESNWQGGDPGTSAWPALGTSPGGTPVPPENPPHSAPLQHPPASSAPSLNPADRSRTSAAQSTGLQPGSSHQQSELSLADGLLQQLNLSGGGSSLQHLPNGLLQSPPSTHSQPQTSAIPGWQPLLGRAGFDWSLGMGSSSESPLGGSFTETPHGVPIRHEGGFATMAAPLVPALDDSSLQQHARSQPIQSGHAPTTHSLLASQLSSSGGSGGLLREVSAARPVPLSPLRTHMAPHGGSPMNAPRTHSSLGSADVSSSGGLKGALRSPGSLLGQSGSPLRSGSQPHGGLVGSILGPANGSQTAQAMPDGIRQIWERGSGGSASSGLQGQAPRLDPRLASPIMEPSMWQTQGPQPPRPSFGQRGVAATLQSYSHASR